MKLMNGEIKEIAKNEGVINVTIIGDDGATYSARYLTPVRHFEIGAQVTFEWGTMPLTKLRYVKDLRVVAYPVKK